MEQAPRDEVVDFVEHWSQRTGLAVKRLLKWLELPGGKYHAWRGRQGQPNVSFRQSCMNAARCSGNVGAPRSG